MLSNYDVRWTLQFFHALSKACLLPLEVTVGSGKIAVRTEGWKRRGYNCVYSLGVLHCSYLWLRLLQCVLNPTKYFRVESFSVHFAVAVFSAAIQQWCGQLFFKYPQETTKSFRDMFQMSNKTVSMRINIKDVKNLLRFSVQELFALIIPFAFGGAFIVYMLIYLAQPENLMHVSSLFGVDLKLWSNIFLWGVPEALFITVHAIPCFFTFFYETGVFVKIFGDFKVLANVIRSKGEKMSVQSYCRSFKLCRRIQIQILLFNQIFSFSLFISKIILILASIGLGFFGFSYFTRFPGLSVLNLFLTLYPCMLTYIIMYDKAFAFPDRMESVKKELRLRSPGLPRRVERKYVLRNIQSIMPVAVKVGDFKKFERTSTPEFCGFVFANIANLLVATKRHA